MEASEENFLVRLKNRRQWGKKAVEMVAGVIKS